MSVWSSDFRVSAAEVEGGDHGLGSADWFDVAFTRLSPDHVMRIGIGDTAVAYLTRDEAITLFTALGDHLARGQLPRGIDPDDAQARRALRLLVERFRRCG